MDLLSIVFSIWAPLRKQKYQETWPDAADALSFANTEHEYRGIAKQYLQSRTFFSPKSTIQTPCARDIKYYKRNRITASIDVNEYDYCLESCNKLTSRNGEYALYVDSLPQVETRLLKISDSQQTYKSLKKDWAFLGTTAISCLSMPP